MTNEPFKLVCKYNNKENKSRGVDVIVVDPTLDVATVRTIDNVNYTEPGKPVKNMEGLNEEGYIQVLEKSPSRIVLGNRTFINTYSRWLDKNVSLRTEYVISREDGEVLVSHYYVNTDHYGGEDIWSSVPMDKSKYMKQNLISRATQPIDSSCKAQKF